jgi:Na+/H+ antiporter NhaA
MTPPETPPTEQSVPEFIEPAAPLETPVHSPKDTLGYYFQPFVMYLILGLYVVIAAGLILQQVNHEDNVVTNFFWKFVRFVDDVLRAWTETE